MNLPKFASHYFLPERGPFRTLAALPGRAAVGQTHLFDEVTAQLNKVYGLSDSDLEAGFVAGQSEAIGNESW